MSQEADRVLPASHVTLAVAWHRQQVSGFPWYARLVITNNTPGLLLDVPIPNERRDQGLIGLRLVRASDNQPLSDVQPWATHDEPTRYTSIHLPAYASQQTLVDLSTQVPATLAPGDYIATVSYAAGPSLARRTAADAAPVSLMAPSDEQLMRRGVLMPHRQTRASWLAAFDEPTPRGVRGWDLPPSDPFAWPALASLAMEAPAEFAALPHTAFQGLPDELGPFVQLLFIEWLQLNGQAARAAEEAQNLTFRAPGLARDVAALMEAG